MQQRYEASKKAAGLRIPGRPGVGRPWMRRELDRRTADGGPFRDRGNRKGKSDSAGRMVYVVQYTQRPERRSSEVGSIRLRRFRQRCQSQTYCNLQYSTVCKVFCFAVTIVSMQVTASRLAIL